jgi:lipid-A-disaccharide synthase
MGEVSIDGPRDETILLLPGSRRFEVQKILPPTLRVLERIRRDNPNLAARVVLAPNIPTEWAREVALSAVTPQTVQVVEWVHGDALKEMARACVGVLKSGTCNLEGAIAGLPFVSVYSGSYFSNLLVSLFVSLSEYSPVNILRTGTVREFMQVRIDEHSLEAEVRKLLTDGSEISRVKGALAEVRDRLSSFDVPADGAAVQPSVAARVAQIALQMVNSSALEGRSAGISSAK